MKHTKFAASAAILLCTISLIGCGCTAETASADLPTNQPNAQTAPENSEQQPPKTPAPARDTQAADNAPANTDASDDTPAADSTEALPADASVFLDSADMLGDVAAVSENGFSLSPLTQSEDATRDDLKSQSSVAVYGKQQPSGEFLAETVFLITYE